MSSLDAPSGLEIAPPHSDLEYNGRQVAYPDQGPQSYQPYLRDNFSGAEIKSAQQPPVPRVCGLDRKKFWMLAAAVVIIITAATLGGTLGERQAQIKNATDSPLQTSALSISSTKTVYTGRSTAISNANLMVTAQVGTINGTQVTLYRDCPSTNDSVYSVQYSSTTYEFRKACNVKFTNNVQATNWVEQPTNNLNDCINLCAAWNENNITQSNADQVCSAVCWRYGFGDDDLPGQCFGFTSVNASSGGFNIQADSFCDSAGWINQA